MGKWVSLGSNWVSPEEAEAIKTAEANKVPEKRDRRPRAERERVPTVKSKKVVAKPVINEKLKVKEIVKKIIKKVVKKKNTNSKARKARK